MNEMSFLANRIINLGDDEFYYLFEAIADEHGIDMGDEDGVDEFTDILNTMLKEIMMA